MQVFHTLLSRLWGNICVRIRLTSNVSFAVILFLLMRRRTENFRWLVQHSLLRRILLTRLVISKPSSGWTVVWSHWWLIISITWRRINILMLTLEAKTKKRKCVYIETNSDLQCKSIDWFLHDRKTGLNPSRSDPGRGQKININFYFPTSLWCLKIPFEAPPRSVKIKI